MRKIELLFIFLVMLSGSAIGQLGHPAIIKDVDGFTNVRSEPSINSEIIFQFKDNEVFTYFVDIDDSTWVSVSIPNNNYSIFTNRGTYKQGFIHKSRLKPLSELEPVTNNDIELIFNIASVDTLTTRQEVRYRDNPSKRLYLIHGFIPFGLDIYLHQSTMVQSLDLIANGVRYPQPDILTIDLYNVSFATGEYSSSTRRFKMFKKDDFLFITHLCADGGGTYEIVWVIYQNRIIQRHISVI